METIKKQIKFDATRFCHLQTGQGIFLVFILNLTPYCCPASQENK